MKTDVALSIMAKENVELVPDTYAWEQQKMNLGKETEERVSKEERM